MWPLGNMDVRATTRPVVPSSQVEQIACRFAAMDPYAGTPAPRKLTGITPTSGLPLIDMSERFVVDGPLRLSGLLETRCRTGVWPDSV